MYVNLFLIVDLGIESSSKLLKLIMCRINLVIGRAYISRVRFALYITIFAILFILIPLFSLKAQSNKDSSNTFTNKIDSLEEADDKSHKLILGFDYMSKVAFWGRTFGINQFGLMPTVMYANPKGFYAFYTGYYWSGEQNKYAKTDLGIGYEKYLTDRLYVSAEYSRWFFYNGNTASRKALTNFIELDSYYDFDFITVGCSYYYMFGIQQSHVFNIELSKDFTLYNLLGANKIIISPSVVATAAANTKTPANPSLFSLAKYQDNPSGIINYEFMLPVEYKIIGLCDLSAAYHFAIPQNAAPQFPLKPFSYFIIESAWTLKKWMPKKAR
jgi:hypothetical protein